MPLNRAALDARCRKLARDLQQDPLLLRRRIVFERLLERLSVAEPEQWMLKGGMALAYRWDGRGRETRDLDLAFLLPEQTTKDDRLLRARLEAACGVALDDGFSFAVLAIRESRADLLGIEGYAISLRSTYLGQPFETVTVDATLDRVFSIPPTPITVESLLPDRQAVELWLTAPEQQFAEKLHALTRTYSEGRPSTRPRDLVDLVALIQRGILDRALTKGAVQEVFAVRGTHRLSAVIAAPSGWENVFSIYGKAYGLANMSVGEGVSIVQRFCAGLGLGQDRAMEPPTV